MKAREIWFTSDWHLGHQNCYIFTNYDGTKMRPWDNFVEAEEVFIENFNKVVGPEDIVYNLGDIGTQTARISYVMDRLVKCKKHHLILGNHDNKIKSQFLLKYFTSLRGAYNLENYIITHIPVSFGSRGRFKTNIHGHTHGNQILLPDGSKDPWYRNVCMDANNYELIPFYLIKEETEKLIEQGKIIIPNKGDRIV